MTEFTPPVSAKDVIAFQPDGSEITYRLRPPTGRTKMAVHRDVQAEGVVSQSNEKLLAAVLDGDISDDDREFVEGAKAALGDTDTISNDDWPRVWELARTVPAAARIMAARSYYGTLVRVHMLRHHLVIKGLRSPVSEGVIDAIPPEDIAALVAHLEEMMAPTKAVAKNSDAP